MFCRCQRTPRRWDRDVPSWILIWLVWISGNRHYSQLENRTAGWEWLPDHPAVTQAIKNSALGYLVNAREQTNWPVVGCMLFAFFGLRITSVRFHASGNFFKQMMDGTYENCDKMMAPGGNRLSSLVMPSMPGAFRVLLPGYQHVLQIVPHRRILGRGMAEKLY